MNSLKDSVLRVLSGDSIVGSAFLVTENLIATCSHVVESAGAKVGEEVALRLGDGREISALVDPEFWRDPEKEDTCLLRLSEPLENVPPVILGSTTGTRGHRFSTFGFPRKDQELAGDGVIVDTATVSGIDVLQLRSDQVTPGFSGAPVFDEVKERVVGMVVSISQVDLYQRLGTTAFAVLAEAIREVCPSLRIADNCPYLGHAAFTEGDAPFFSGRDRIVSGLLGSLRREPRFLLVRGPSGCGKSSVIQGGLFPAIRAAELPGSETWDIVAIRSGSNPYEQLALAGFPEPQNGLKKAVEGWPDAHPGKTRLVLFIDQVEELLISCPEAVCNELIRELAQLLDESIFITVVLALRDDFYERFSELAEPLTKWMNRAQVQIPLLLERAEQYAIVNRPAHQAGVTFAEGLVNAILDDVLAGDGQADSLQSTHLPLLEYTLKQLWERRNVDAVMTWDAYHAIGRLGGYLPQQAGAFYRSLSDDQKELMRFIFRRVVKGGASLEVRQAQRQELYPCGVNPKQIDSLIVALSEGNSRLLLARDTSVELIHPRLLEWTIIKDLFGEDPDYQTLRQALMDDAVDWDKDRSSGNLYDLSLSSYIEKSKNKSDFSTLEWEFITASKRKGQRRLLARIAFFSFLSLVVLAIVAIAGPAVFIGPRVQNFYASKEGTERMSSLSSIIRFPTWLGESPRKRAQALFSGLPTEEQQGLFENYHGDGTDLEIVISTVYVSLGEPAPNDQTTSILRSMHKALSLFPDVAENTNLSQELDAWIAARDGVAVRDNIGALKKYTEAIQYNPENPATHFERGLLFIQIDQYDQALQDLELTVKLGKSLLPASIQPGTATPETTTMLPDSKRLASTQITADLLSKIIHQNLKLAWTLANSDTDAYPHLKSLGLDFSNNAAGNAARIEIDLTWENSNDLDLWIVDEDNLRTDYRNPSPDNGWKLAKDANPDCHTKSKAAPSRERITWSGKELPTNVIVGVQLFRFCDGNQSTPFELVVTIDGKKTPYPGEITTEKIDQTVQVLNPKPEAKLLLRIPAKESGAEVRDIAFSKDSQSLIVLANSIRFFNWKIDTEEVITLASDRDELLDIDISKDNALLAAGGKDGALNVWVMNGNPQLLYHRQEDAGEINQVLFSPDTRFIAYATGGSDIKLLDSYSGEVWTTLSDPSQRITSLAFSPDGNILAAGSSDGLVILWTLKSDTENFEKSFIPASSAASITSLTFAGDGQALAVGDEAGTIQIWDALNKRKVADIDAHTGAITDILFSRDHKLLVSAALDAKINIWDGETEKIIFTLPENKNSSALRLAFSPDERFIAAGLQNGDVMIWDSANLNLRSPER